MYNQNKAQQSKNCVHISWDILYVCALQRNFFLNQKQTTIQNIR